MKVGDKIFYGYISINEYGQLEEIWRKHKVIGAHEHRAVLDDNMFTRITDEEEGYCTFIKLEYVECKKHRLIPSYPEEIYSYVYTCNANKEQVMDKLTTCIKDFIQRESWTENKPILKLLGGNT